MSIQVVRARKRLFDAGWRPSMAGLAADPKFHALLLALNEANRKKTMKRL